MCQLSVIIPTCNRNDLLRQAILSVISQNINDYEVVIVDDSTQPSTPNFIHELSKIASIRYVINEGEHGAARARNKGVKEASGKYITFLDDDDIYLPGRLKSMLEKFEKFDLIFVSSGRFNQINDFFDIKSVPQYFGVIQLEHVLFGNHIDIGFMILRDKFIKLGGFDENLNSLEDWDFIIRCLQTGIGYKQKRLDYVVNRDPSISRVSDLEVNGYKELENKWRNTFSSRWSAFMLCTALRLGGKYDFFSSLSLSVKYRTLLPIISYFSYLTKGY